MKLHSCNLVSLCAMLIFSTNVNAAFNTTKKVYIRSEPPDAKITVDGIAWSQKAPAVIPSIKWKPDPPEVHSFEISLEGYDPILIAVTYAEAKAAKGNTVELSVVLQSLTTNVTARFDTSPKDAVVKLTDGRTVNTSQPVDLFFTRASSKVPWVVQQATLSATDHAPKSLDLDFGTLKANPKVSASLERIRQLYEITLSSNQGDAELQVDGKVVGKGNIKHPFEFKKDTSTGRWNSFQVLIRKEKFVVKRAGAPSSGADDYFLKVLTKEEAESTRQIHADLELQRFLPVQRVHIDFSEAVPRFLPEIVYSEINELPVGVAPLKVSNFAKGELIDTRLCLLSGGEVAYSAPPNPVMKDQFKDGMPPHRMHIFSLGARGKSRITQAPGLEIDPCVSPDGRTLYFSSNRTRPDRMRIHSIFLDGRPGVSSVTADEQSLYDLEPAVSPDGKTLAFTRLSSGKKDKQIWLRPTDGKLETELIVGENPSWSPDSKRIAFVSKDRQGMAKISIKELDGPGLVELDLGQDNKRHPCWTPDGKRIVYCSDESKNEDGRPTWNIYIASVDRAFDPVNLTSSGSHHERPIVSAEGKFIYYLTSKGAQDSGEPFLQIFRIPVPPLETTAPTRQATPPSKQ